MQALLASALLFAAGPLAAFAQAPAPATIVPTPRTNTTTASTCKTLKQLLSTDTDLTSIGALLQDANVLDELNDYTGNLTLFLPNNAAFTEARLATDMFGEIDQTSLAEVLATHVVAEQRVVVKNITADAPRTVQSLQQDPACFGVLTVSSEKGAFIVNTQFNEAGIVTPDVPICNGLVQIIDAILIPCESVSTNLTADFNATDMAPAPAPVAVNKTHTPTPTPTHTPTPIPSRTPTPEVIATVAPAPTVTASAAPANRSVNAPAPSSAGVTMVQATMAALALLAAVFVL